MESSHTLILLSQLRWQLCCRDIDVARRSRGVCPYELSVSTSIPNTRRCAITAFHHEIDRSSQTGDVKSSLIVPRVYRITV